MQPSQCGIEVAVKQLHEAVTLVQAQLQTIQDNSTTSRNTVTDVVGRVLVKIGLATTNSKLSPLIKEAGFRHYTFRAT